MAITELEITRRSSFAGGENFGDVGPYELLEGTAHYAVEPLHASNQGITDLDLAPRNSVGKVEFSSDFAMLRPLNPDQANRRILFDVVNRGRKTALTLNSVPTATDPTAPLEAGNGYLMRRGYTVVWAGWQADVPPTPGLIGLHAPEAIGQEGPLTGRVLCQFQCDQPTQVFLLADRQHLPNPAADPEEAGATLTVRDLPNSPATPWTEVIGPSFGWKTRTLSLISTTSTCLRVSSPAEYTSWCTPPRAAASWAWALPQCGTRFPF